MGYKKRLLNVILKSFVSKGKKKNYTILEYCREFFFRRDGLIVIQRLKNPHRISRNFLPPLKRAFELYILPTAHNQSDVQAFFHSTRQQLCRGNILTAKTCARKQAHGIPPKKKIALAPKSHNPPMARTRL